MISNSAITNIKTFMEVPIKANERVQYKNNNNWNDLII